MFGKEERDEDFQGDKGARQGESTEPRNGPGVGVVEIVPREPLAAKQSAEDGRDEEECQAQTQEKAFKEGKGHEEGRTKRDA
jgi:hypothetical protein